MSSDADVIVDSAPAPARCDGCGLETTEPGLLQPRRKSFRSTKVNLCASCLVDSLKDAQVTNWVILGLSALFLLGFGMVMGRTNTALYFVGMVAAILVMSPLSIIIHELGHVVVARALDWQVFGIVLGYGKLLWQGRIGNMVLQFRFAQLGGMAWCAPRRGSRFIPLKAFFVFAAGPAVNALAAWAGFLVYQSVYIFEPPYGAIFTVPGMWIFLNAFNAAVSLLPYKTSVTGVSLGSDGHQMLQAIFQPAELRSRYVYGRGIIAFTSLRQLGYREQAHHAITEHLRDFPDDVFGLQCLSAAEAALENYARCAEVAEKGLRLLEEGAEIHPAAMSGQTPLFRKVIEAAFQCNVAYGRLKGNIGTPEEALELARQARDTIPWFPAVQNTYGYALAKTGDPVAGLGVLKAIQGKLNEEPAFAREQAMETLREVEAMARGSANGA